MIIRPAKQHGITLIELMVVVAIIAILAAVAYPGYQSYVVESARSEAYTNLLKIVDMQERLYLQNNAYSTPTSFAYSAPEASPLYTYTLTNTPTNGFTATATAVTGKSQAADTGCTAISIASTGSKTPAACW